MTIRELLGQGAALIAAGPDGGTAWLDATILWALATGSRRDRVLACLGDTLPPEDPQGVSARFLDSCRRRATGYPIAYLSGRKEFFGRDFRVDESVLIPRPETECLVEWILETIDAEAAAAPRADRAAPVPPPLRFLDCCTGSGCIPITIGLELARARRPAEISACDLSAAALSTAEANRALLWPEGSLAWHQGDLLEAVPTGVGLFDIISANPPYVPRTEALATGAKGWREPLLALDGGPDGLDLIRRLVPQAIGRLKPGGWLFLEFGDGQSEAIVDILESNDCRSTEIRCDLAGLPRMARSKSGERDGQGS